ncbi:MAG: diguanylate cyclase [Ruminococcus sp.]|nr:diguanylate cyclase [Ruminococcus sp.]
MDEKKSFFSVKVKICIFVFIIVFAMATGTSAVAFYSSANQINDYYKRCTTSNARYFSTMVDGDYLAKLRATAESEEFQALRNKAVKYNDEELIKDYLREHGLWDEYVKIQETIEHYLQNMTNIKYLYVTAHGDKDAVEDMYLIDSPDEPVFQTGYYEKREKELLGLDLGNHIEPTITKGEWGWLCSSFCPVYNSDGECVCIVGCDFDMEEVMNERNRFLVYLIMGALIFTVVVQTIAIILINRLIGNPLKSMTIEMKKFNPAENLTYKEAGVMELNIKNRDEIGDLYHGIRAMQMNFIDRLNDLSALQQDKLKAEQDIRDKELQIGRLSKEAQKDMLTGVGSKAAYESKVNLLNVEMSEGDIEFALVMVDMNKLKNINDSCGHKAGDQYIRGCCRMVCEVFKHSPVYRIGGDEFIVVLQGHDYKERHALVENLRRNFDQKYNQTELKPWFRYSAAVGMAENASYDTTVDPVFKRADNAMYEEKKRFKTKYGIKR